MITRVVKMHFSESFVEDFKMIFAVVQPKIMAFDGCSEVKLLQQEENVGVFFTFSKWENSKKLNEYRASSLFIETWTFVKPKFVQKAEAWTLVDV